VSSSPNVTLFWQTRDDEGRVRPPSSLIERLRLALPETPVETAPDLWTPVADDPRPAHEHAVLAGLHDPDRLDEFVEISLRAEQPRGRVQPRALARARSAVRRELDPDAARARRLGPQYGFVGPVVERADTRGANLYVTTLERYATCPWQTLLTRLLRIEATPDALEALPTLSPRVVGSAVHAALESVVARVLGSSGGELAEQMERTPTAVVWPEPKVVGEIARVSARQALLEEGVELPGLTRALARQISPYLESARQRIFSGAGAPVVAAEAHGTLRVLDEAGRSRALHFRADLVERAKDIVRISDYKTGRPISTAVKAETRRRHLLGRLRLGVALQVFAYRGAAGPDAEGHYVYLQPDLADEHARIGVGDDPELDGLFRATTRLLLSGIDAGVFAPRLLQADGRAPAACRFCDVAEACLQGDSGAVQRLARFAARGKAGSREEELLLRLWNLGREDAT
jgi:hypothetical protein